MDIVSIVGIILVIAVISMTIKNYLPEYSIMINISSSIIILTIILSKLIPVLDQINSLLETTKIPKEYCAILFKSLGICLISQFAADTCRDAKENSLANKVELAGKTTIIITALPLFQEIIQTVLKLMR